jgi:hypothetical protein
LERKKERSPENSPSSYNFSPAAAWTKPPRKTDASPTMLRLRLPSKAAAAVAAAAASIAGVAYAYTDGGFSFHRQPAARPSTPGLSPRNNEFNPEFLERTAMPCTACLENSRRHGDQIKADYPDKFPSATPRT